MENIRLLTDIVAPIAFLLLYVVLFFMAKWIKGLFSSYKLDEQLTDYDNDAVSVSASGYFLATAAIFVGAYFEPGKLNLHVDRLGNDWGLLGLDLIEVAVYTLGGILMLNFARLVNARLVLYKFSVDKEIVNDQNPGTGVVEGAMYLATGLIVAGAVHGEGSWLTAVVFFLIGELCLVVFGLLYVWLSPFDVHAEIERDNVAAGLGFAGGLVSIGIIVMKGIAGDFVDWQTDLLVLGKDILLIFVLLAVVRLIFDRLFLRNSNLQTEIVQDQNWGAGLLEMVVSIGFAVILFFVL